MFEAIRPGRAAHSAASELATALKQTNNSTGGHLRMRTALAACRLSAAPCGAEF